MKWPLARGDFEYLLIARGEDGIHMDFPTGWALARIAPEHDPKCSFTQTGGALLCDCRAIFHLAEQLLGDDLILLLGEAEKLRETGWGPQRKGAIA